MKTYIRRYFQLLTQAPQHKLAVHDRGQTTAEYALVLLAAGTVAMLVVAWAQDSNSIGELFDAIMSKITGLTD